MSVELRQNAPTMYQRLGGRADTGLANGTDRGMTHFLDHAQVVSFLSSYGYWAVFVIVALESAGAPLPGETILVKRPRHRNLLRSALEPKALPRVSRQLTEILTGSALRTMVQKVGGHHAIEATLRSHGDNIGHYRRGRRRSSSRRYRFGKPSFGPRGGMASDSDHTSGGASECVELRSRLET